MQAESDIQKILLINQAIKIMNSEEFEHKEENILEVIDCNIENIECVN